MNDRAQTVFVVDDTAEVRLGLTRLLGIAGYQVCAFESARRFLEEHDSTVPGCVVLDLCLPGTSGLDVQRWLSHLVPTRPVIFLSGYADIQTSVDAMKMGAVDFLTKPIDEVRLFAAIARALQLDFAHRYNCAIRRNIERRLQALTPRERQVMDQVILGRLNKHIAADLGISEKTVKVHRSHVMKKMVVRSVAELVGLAARVGLPEAGYRQSMSCPIPQKTSPTDWYMRVGESSVAA